MRSVTFTLTADAELTSAEAWYEDQGFGLGSRFLLVIEGIVGRVSDNPRQFPLVYKSVRRALSRRFPHSVLFVIEDDDSITVIACFHSSRDPSLWQQRI